VSAIRAAAAATQNLPRRRHVTTENLPKLHARFFLMPRPASGRGRAKSPAHPGKRHRAGATRANRGLVGKNFATICRAMKKNGTKRPDGLPPAERKAWDDIVREMDAIS
jgi:hypothetical protein